MRRTRWFGSQLIDRPSICFGVMLLAVLLPAGSAWAQGRSGQSVRLLILEPQSAFLSPSQLQELGQALQTLAADHPGLTPVESPGLSQLMQQAKCKGLSNRCLAAMGKRAGAQQLVLTQIQKLPGRHLVVLRLVDVQRRRQIKRVRQRARPHLVALRTSLRKGWEAMFGKVVDCEVRVLANVEEADVHLDGRPVGKSPLTISEKLLAGPHTLRVSHPDYRPSVRKIRLGPSRRRTQVRVNLKLKPTKDGIPPVALVSKADRRKLEAAKDGQRRPKDGLEPGDEDLAAAEKAKAAKPAEAKQADGGPGEEKPEGVKSEPAVPTPAASRPSTTGVAREGREPTAGPEGPKEPASRVEVEVLGAKSSVLEQPFVAGFDDASKPQPGPTTTVPIYKRWWFWTAIGAVAVAGAVTGTVLALSGEEGIPSGKGRLTIQF